jgi:hypothetical protein
MLQNVRYKIIGIYFDLINVFRWELINTEIQKHEICNSRKKNAMEAKIRNFNDLCHMAQQHDKIGSRQYHLMHNILQYDTVLADTHDK